MSTSDSDAMHVNKRMHQLTNSKWVWPIIILDLRWDQNFRVDAQKSSNWCLQTMIIDHDDAHFCISGAGQLVQMHASNVQTSECIACSKWIDKNRTAQTLWASTENGQTSTCTWGLKQKWTHLVIINCILSTENDHFNINSMLTNRNGYFNIDIHDHESIMHCKLLRASFSVRNGLKTEFDEKFWWSSVQHLMIATDFKHHDRGCLVDDESRLHALMMWIGKLQSKTSM